MFQEEGALPDPPAAQPNPSLDLGAHTVGGDELWHIPVIPLPRRASQVTCSSLPQAAPAPSYCQTSLQSAHPQPEPGWWPWGQLTDDPADGLQRGELLILDVQSFVGDHVLLGQHLPARGADAAVEVGGGVRLPNVLFVLFGFIGALFLLHPEVVVSREQFLLLGRVWQQHQQLLENLPEVLPQQLPAAFVILSCRDQPLQGTGKGKNQRKINIYLLKIPLGFRPPRKGGFGEPLTCLNCPE